MFGGYRGTLAGLGRLARPGGLLLVGEPFWRRPPAPAYLEATGVERSDFGTHLGNARAAKAEGLDVVFTTVSTPEDFDTYEGLQWAAADAWARRHPADPDRAEVVARVDHDREAYLRWGRDSMGWACYMLGVPERKGTRGRKAPGKEKAR